MKKNPIKIQTAPFSRMGMREAAKIPSCKGGRFRKNFLAKLTSMAGILLFGFLCSQVAAAEGMDPEAEKILRSMSDFMGKLSAFSATADIDNEIIDSEGQKLQFSSSAKILLKRPNLFHVSRQGGIIHMDFIFDGKVLTLYGRNAGVYFQKQSPGTTDTAIETLHDEIGLNTPGADLLYTDTYSILSEGISSSAYMGTSYVNGVECHYLTFREPHVDWQIWVKAEGDPLPMKYVITTKWMTGAPQYSVRLRDWDMSPKIDSGQFDFKPPEGAKKLDEILINDMGELALEEEEQ
jgi:hypothetical protein